MSQISEEERQATLSMLRAEDKEFQKDKYVKAIERLVGRESKLSFDPDGFGEWILYFPDKDGPTKEQVIEDLNVAEQAWKEFNPVKTEGVEYLFDRIHKWLDSDKQSVTISSGLYRLFWNDFNESTRITK